MIRLTWRSSACLSSIAQLALASAFAFAGTVADLSTGLAAELRAKTIYSFEGGRLGRAPSGALVLDKAGVLGVAGALYGTTEYGGDKTRCYSTDPDFDGCGTIYRLLPPTPSHPRWEHEILYRFTGEYNTAKSGQSPKSGLVLDARRRALYGTSSTGVECLDGGSCGLVFQLTPPRTLGRRWNYRIIYRFRGGTADGESPVGELTLRRRAIYGATGNGGLGSFGYGVIYRLAPPPAGQTAWQETVLYKFKGGRDGASPRVGVTFGPIGALYGTTNFGGGCAAIEPGCGTVYRLIPPAPGQTAWTEEVLYRFRAGDDGYFPLTGVAVHSNGAVVGTTSYGGRDGYGILFALQPQTASASRGSGGAILKKLKDNEDAIGELRKKEEDPDSMTFLETKYVSSLGNPIDVMLERKIDTVLFFVENLKSWRSRGGWGEPGGPVYDERTKEWYVACDGCRAGDPGSPEDGVIKVFPP